MPQILYFRLRIDSIYFKSDGKLSIARFDTSAIEDIVRSELASKSLRLDKEVPLQYTLIDEKLFVEGRAKEDSDFVGAFL